MSSSWESPSTWLSWDIHCRTCTGAQESSHPSSDWSQWCGDPRQAPPSTRSGSLAEVGGEVLSQGLCLSPCIEVRPLNILKKQSCSLKKKERTIHDVKSRIQDL